MIILELLSETGLTLHELAKQYDTYFSSGEINSTVDDRASKIEELKIAFSNANSIDELDGISIWYPDAWCNIRPSNTEPLLRLNVEGRTQKAMESLKNRALNIIRS
jgi:phosphomannomutase